MSTTSTEIAPFIQAGIVALKQEGASIKSVAEAMAEPFHPDVARVEEVPFPPVPKPVKMTPEVEQALLRLPEVFGRVQPEQRRMLSEDEKAAVHAEREVLKVLATLISERDGNLKEIIRHHMDVDAEERGVAVPKAVVDTKSGEVIVEATDRDPHGHYVLCKQQEPERCTIPGTNLEWSREYRAGSVNFQADPADLAEMEAEGEIDRATYLAITREVRVFDEDKARAALHDQSKCEAVLGVIRRFTKVGRPGTALFTRKKKN